MDAAGADQVAPSQHPRDDGAERAPQPGLRDLEVLRRAAQAAGASLQWELHLPEVPAALGLSAYRTVQQGLANAARHAPGAPVRGLTRNEVSA
ncbi:hypothetical protein [Modestobacter sp. VKM Ac-2978]|uniref:hypothetical protein n=1 Tax=Modestobacter sp. VKM Ac-2978 TaxID=3004132 RepID=UPI0022AA2270|nr:hypothetical protein [Modestobacter sp. VKM Ac-2978]MCZ2847326.1 hypothetical protein [Modestobacter sp. VKM Ac-2978]